MPHNRKYLQIKEPELEVSQQHPLRNQRNHDALLEYIRDRLDFGARVRDQLVGRYEEIDRKMAGFLRLSKEDLERERENLQGRAEKPTAIKVQFAYTQINRGVTFLLSVFSPEGGMFEAIASGDNQKIANAITKVMNDDSIHSGYFRQLAIFFMVSLKYNLGGVRVWWDQEFGPRPVAQSDGRIQVDREFNAPLWEGNRVKASDMYNTIFDPSVSPVDLHKHGEFVAEVGLHTPFRIKMMAEAGEIYGTDRLFSSDAKPRGSGFETYYRRPPDLRFGVGNELFNSDGSPNWFRVLSVTGGHVEDMVDAGIELVPVHIRLLPKEFGLVGSRTKGRDQLEIWKIIIANGQFIVNAQHVPNMHNWLPYAFAMPLEDNLGMESQSVAENLLPLQSFANFLLNTHVAGTRKNIWDLIIYDPTIVDLHSIGEDVAARVPTHNSATNKDITKAIWKPDIRVDTSQTMQDMESVIELMEFIFPTRTVQQVASLERATTLQAAAVVQGSHRDLWRYAKIMDDQAAQPMRQMMYSNIIQFRSTISVIGPDGRSIDVQPGEVVNANIEFAIGEGLKSIDRLTVVQNLKEVINAIIQNREALAEYDVPALLNWWSSLFGVQQDLSAFTRQQTGREAPIAPADTQTEGPQT